MTAPAMRCRACESDVPTGAFCGSCGAHLFGERADGYGYGRRLRVRDYVAAPEEHVLRLSTATTLFPQVPPRSHTPFRLGLVVLLALLVTFAVLRWQALMIAVAAFGFAILFLVYVRESGAARDAPLRTLALTAGSGALLGLVWAVPSGAMVAQTYDVPLGDGPEFGPAVLSGLAVSIVGALLMLAPAVLARATRRPTGREALDGYVIGALGAVTFNVAATVARLTPQLASGPVGYGRSQTALLVEAVIQGIAMPIAGAAVGGLFGLALWFSGRGAATRRVSGRAVAAAVLVGVALYGALGVLEIVPLQQGLHLGMHLLLTALALLALRVGVQLALLRGEPDEMRPDQPLLCAHCDHVVPDMAFCPNCGVASRTAAQTSSTRIARRLEPASGVDGAEVRARPGYAVPPGSYAVAPLTVTTIPRLLAGMGAGVGLAVVGALTMSVLITPPVVHYTCPPDCGRPPLGTPVETNPRFTAADGSFSVSYPGSGTAYRVVEKPSGVVLDFLAGDTGTLELFGQPAHNRTPREVAEDLIAANYPDATVDYEIPNASVGYESGYGVVADEYPMDTAGTYARLRIIVMVAVKNDHALSASAVGPYHQFSPQFGSGHPSGTNLELALDMAKYVNSFRWRGDPAR